MFKPLVNFFLFFFLFSIVSIAVIAPSGAQVTTANTNDAKSEVEHVLRTQQEAWNRHDLDGFMAGYWNSPELTFFSPQKKTMGGRP